MSAHPLLAQNSIKKRFARTPLLLVGCGDVGFRLLPYLCEKFNVRALSTQARNSERFTHIRQRGALPLTADLDDARSVSRFAGLADTVVYLAPPPQVGLIDTRLRNLLAILPDNCRFVYISTTGVYGDVQGAYIDETQKCAPQTARALRRTDAENRLRAWALRRRARVSILRVPGIYAQDRLPIERLHKGTPALCAEDDVFTNHIHADDLAKLIFLCLFRGRANRCYNACDESEMKMGDYFDLVADRMSLPRPKRLPRTELKQSLSETQWSFMCESRRLINRRMVCELGMRLSYSKIEDLWPSVPLV